MKISNIFRLIQANCLLMASKQDKNGNSQETLTVFQAELLRKYRKNQRMSCRTFWMFQGIVETKILYRNHPAIKWLVYPQNKLDQNPMRTKTRFFSEELFWFLTVGIWTIRKTTTKRTDRTYQTQNKHRGKINLK